MDGTLIESNEASELIWKTWSAPHGVDMEKIRAVHHGRRPEETIAIVAPHLDAKKEAQFIYDDQDVATNGIYPIAGVHEFYHSLPSGSFGVVTAATQTILEHRFRIVGLSVPKICVTAGILKKGKPDPEGYLLGAEKLGLLPKDCIVFEDAPAGLLAAKRAGMRSVAITTHYTREQFTKEMGTDFEPVLIIRNYLGFTLNLSEYGSTGIFQFSDAAKA
jgi:sugar-phosphatase